jgi:cytochrome c
MTYDTAKLFAALRNKILKPSLVHLLAIAILSAMPPLLGMAAGGGTAAADDAADAEHGQQLFEKRCTGCHSLDQDREGPRLRNVYGRKAGSVSTFKYSDALKSTQITWNDASLERWLANPEAVAPDTDMNFHVPKADERAAIIRFLRLSSGK